jgi:phosphoribosylamine--glycine ligase
LVEVVSSAFDGTLGDAPLEWDARATIGVVMASRGYPDSYDKGQAISGLDAPLGADAKIFHAGTRLDGDTVVTDGGRVLCVVGAGASVRSARDAAYGAVRKVSWDGAFYRTDIGYRAIAREESR